MLIDSQAFPVVLNFCVSQILLLLFPSLFPFLSDPCSHLPLLPSPLSFLLFAWFLLSSIFLPSILLCYSHLSFPVSSHISSPPLLSPLIPSPPLPTSIHLSPPHPISFTLPSPLVPFYSFPPLLPFSPFLSLFLSSYLLPFVLLTPSPFFSSPLFHFTLLHCTYPSPNFFYPLLSSYFLPFALFPLSIIPHVYSTIS